MNRDAFPSHSIAIVGLAGRFPGARDLEGFWQNVRSGVESLETFSESDLDAAGVDARTRASPQYVRRGTVLEGADQFDAGFFGISPREAQILDPQHRVFLECAWEALEDAGYSTDTPGPSVGVYAGASMNTYLLAHILRNPALTAAVGGYQLMLGNDKDFLCTRVSYKLNLRGPSVTLQTACSTSLVAVVMAGRALLRGECDIALAGGVSLTFPGRSGYLYQEGMILSPDGHCRPFDVAAGGTRAGAGCGIVVLKRLADAISDRDTIHAVIRGAAINNDGADKAGYTAPSVDGQMEVIATAQALAGVSPRDIGFVEAHGTGTPLGDPIEIAALTQAFRAGTDAVGFCRLGSLKANLGHLDAAAGVAGLIKAVLVLKRREFPPLVNFTAPNPRLELDTSPFTASATGAAWPSQAPRRAAVSSFGIGGTNAHVVLEEGPEVTAPGDVRDAHLLVLSARTEAALDAMSANLARHLAAAPEAHLEDIEWTLQMGRRTFPHRRAVVVTNRAQAIEALTEPKRPPVASAVYEGAARPVAFLFSGQGSQHAGMGQQLYHQEPVYRDAVDRCAAALESHLGADIRKLMFDEPDPARINETGNAQPALFVTEYALAQLWKSWGVEPAAMLGHSIGELVAAQLAGVFTLEDALAAVALRGRLMQSLPPGSMAAVHLPAADLKKRLPAAVEIAAVNAPALCTISGPSAVLAETVAALQGAGVDCRPLHTSHAFHSSMMQSALAPFTAFIQRLTLRPPQVPYISNVTGIWITPEQATSASYYADHLRGTVMFESGVRAIAADPSMMLLEVGPGEALTTLARLTIGREGPKRVAQSLGRVRDERRETARVREAAARLWLGGVPIGFTGLHPQRSGHRVPLPTYPFERKSYWVEAATASRDEGGAAAAQNRPASRRLEDWLYAPTWSRDESLVMPAALSGIWLVLGDEGALSREVLTAAQSAGGAPVLLVRGNVYREFGPERFSVRPGSADDLATVLAALKTRHSDVPVRGAIDLWSVGTDACLPADAYDVLVALGTHLGNSPGISVNVVHVTVGAESLFGEPAPQPRTALPLGPVLVMPVESVGLRMRTVDIEAREGAAAPAAIASVLVAEAAAGDGVRRIVWRGTRRWLHRFERIALPAADDRRQPVKPRGIYLITGGLGGLGLSFAQWFGETFKARLLLTSRSGVPERSTWDSVIATDATGPAAAAIRAIRAIEAAGGEVMVAAADAADEVAMGKAIALSQQAWGNFNGLVHAAGITGTGHLTVLGDSAAARAVFAPKAGGLDVLVKLLGSQPLDFVALMSSINALFGTAGNSDYSSANAVLDAFADGTARPSGWRQVVSFNWGPWQQVGMAAKLEVAKAHRAQWEAVLANAIPTAQGVEAFARGLASGRARVIVVSFDLLAEVAMRESAPMPVASVAQSTDNRQPSSGPTVRPASSTASWESPLEEQLAGIWRELLGVEEIGRNDDFFELGGHSLLATRVLARIQEAMGARLTLREVFEAPTLGHMAALVQRTQSAMVDTGSEEREEMEF